MHWWTIFPQYFTAGTAAIARGRHRAGITCTVMDRVRERVRIGIWV